MARISRLGRPEILHTLTPDSCNCLRMPITGLTGSGRVCVCECVDMCDGKRHKFRATSDIKCSPNAGSYLPLIQTDSNICIFFRNNLYPLWIQCNNCFSISNIRALPSLLIQLRAAVFYVSSFCIL